MISLMLGGVFANHGINTNAINEESKDSYVDKDSKVIDLSKEDKKE